MKRLLLFIMLLPILAQAQILRLNLIAATPPGPYLQLNPTGISGMTSTAGTIGSSSGYTLSWFQWVASADTVTAPSGFVVSSNNTTFASSVIIPTSGTTGAASLYVALAAGNSPGNYSGNVVHQSGSVSINLPVSGNTNGVPTLGVSPTSLTLTDTVGTPGNPQTLTATFAYLSGNVNVTIPTAPVPLEMSIDGGTTWVSSLSLSTSPQAIKVRVTSSASTGPIADTIAFAASGVSTVKIPVGGAVTNPSTSHYRTITIPTTSVTSTLTNFPMLVNLTQTYLKTVANGGEVQNANAYDVTFSTDAAGTSLLNWEVETYNASTGQLIAWVKVPTVSSSSNTVIYMRYNQPSITTFQGGSQGGVWDANYVGVWHMNQQLTAAGQSETDYTSNGNNNVAHGTWTTGQTVSGPVGSALQALNANGDYLQWATSGIGGLTADFTVEGWFNVSVASNTSFAFGSPTYGNDVNWYQALGHLYNGGGDNVSSVSTISTNTWFHIAITRAGTTYTWYQNGTLDNSATGTLFTFNFQDLYINLSSISQNIIGDEVRISTTARSAAWVGAEYTNMNSPSSFYTVGPEN